MVEAEDVGNDKPSSQEENVTDMEKKIIRQVEYYFGDINLTRDKFLLEQIKLDDGWIPMETMLKFNRLSQLSKDPEVIIKALKKSSSNLMEVSEDNSKIRRSPNKPLPEMNEGRRKELMSRTVYCKGFSCEDTKMHQLLDFFPQFGDIDNIIMRSYNDKATQTWKFKGSVFVVFSKVEAAQEFLNLESVKYNDVELIRKWQNVYLDEKKKERLESRGKSKKKKTNKEEKDGDDNGKTDEAEETKNEGGDGDNKDDKKDEFPRGSVVQLKGLGVEKNLKRDEIKEAVEKLGVGVAFVEFSSGQDEAWLRLDSEGAALELAGLVKGGILEIGNLKAELRVIEGEEEEIFLNKCLADKKKLVQRSRNKARRGRPRKRRGSQQRDGFNKSQKTE